MIIQLFETIDTEDEEKNSSSSVSTHASLFFFPHHVFPHHGIVDSVYLLTHSAIQKEYNHRPHVRIFEK